MNANSKPIKAQNELLATFNVEKVDTEYLFFSILDTNLLITSSGIYLK